MSRTPEPRRSAGRPRERVLSREVILKEAFALAEEHGADFTLAKLARRLEVRPSALHYYFKGKLDLISGMRGYMTQRMGSHDFTNRPWHEAIIDWARAYRKTFGAHPALIAALATLPIAGEPESIADYEHIVEAFRRANYPEHRIVPAIVAVDSFVIGSALDSLTPADNLKPLDDSAPALIAAERAGRDYATTRGTDPATEAFEFGLRALIAGLRSVPDFSGNPSINAPVAS